MTADLFLSKECAIDLFMRVCGYSVFLQTGRQ